MLQNDKVIAFTVFELVRGRGGVKSPYQPPRSVLNKNIYFKWKFGVNLYP